MELKNLKTMKTTMEIIKVLAESQKNGENFDTVVICSEDDMTILEAISFLTQAGAEEKWEFSTQITKGCLHVW
jgi:CMP-N-acetylneuraminic acid synthetase